MNKSTNEYSYSNKNTSKYCKFIIVSHTRETTYPPLHNLTASCKSFVNSKFLLLFINYKSELNTYIIEVILELQHYSAIKAQLYLKCGLKITFSKITKIQYLEGG